MSFTTIANIFFYYSTYSILICDLCKKAISSCDAISHLKSHISTNQLASNDWLNTISNIAIQPTKEAYIAIQENEPIEPIYSLAVVDGWVCTRPGCSNLAISHYRMIRHLSDDHKISRDRHKRSMQPCKVQSLSTNRYLFKVESPPASLPARPSAIPSSIPSTRPSAIPSSRPMPMPSSRPSPLDSSMTSSIASPRASSRASSRPTPRPGPSSMPRPRPSSSSSSSSSSESPDATALSGNLAQLVLDQFNARIKDLQQNQPITMYYSCSE